MKKIDYSLQFIGTGIYIIILLQVFNWFRARSVHWVMALWTMSQGLGSVANTVIDRKFNYIKLYAMAAIFAAFAILDYFYFRMHPA